MYRSEVLTAESLCDSAASKQRLSAEEGGCDRRCKLLHPRSTYITYSYSSLWSGQYPCVLKTDHGSVYSDVNQQEIDRDSYK